jgi:hypothetical protein
VRVADEVNDSVFVARAVRDTDADPVAVFVAEGGGGEGVLEGLPDCDKLARDEADRCGDRDEDSDIRAVAV